MRAALAATFRATLYAEHTELIATLNLTAKEQKQFLAILAQGRRRIVGEHQFSLVDNMMSGAETTRQLRDLLGEARFPDYRAFHKSSVERDVAREMSQSLYFTPTPLLPGQAEQLKRMVAATLADEAMGPKYKGNTWTNLLDVFWEKIATQAQGVLGASQLEALNALRKQSQFFHAQSESLKQYHAAKTDETKAPP